MIASSGSTLEVFQRIVCGADGTPEGLIAVESTTDQLDRAAAHAIAPELEEQDAPAVNVLVAASESADLVVVGSRGLHGLKALGGVSERVAHDARSSVLVVRSGPG